MGIGKTCGILQSVYIAGLEIFNLKSNSRQLALLVSKIIGFKKLFLFFHKFYLFLRFRITQLLFRNKTKT